MDCSQVCRHCFAGGGCEGISFEDFEGLEAVVRAEPEGQRPNHGPPRRPGASRRIGGSSGRGGDLDLPRLEDGGGVVGEELSGVKLRRDTSGGPRRRGVIPLVRTA